MIDAAVGNKTSTLGGGGTHVEANGNSAATSNVSDQLAGSISGAQHDGSNTPIVLPSFNGGSGIGVRTPVFGDILVPQAQRLINAMASFAPPEAASMTAIVNHPGATPAVLAPGLH
jgi:hypothetical protein